jgi:hypothetical protein
VRPVKSDEFSGPLAEHGLSQRIGEDGRVVVNDQVGGACGRRRKRGQARLSVSYHAGKITIEFHP